MAFFNPEQDTEKHRHNLPHWQQNKVWIFLTYRLADSLPQVILARWKEERTTWFAHHPEPWDENTEAEYHQRFTDRIDRWLDQGHGSCLLQSPENAQIVANAFEHFDGERYRLVRYVVMPNHVHLLFHPLACHRLPDLVHTWKRFTAREINKRENRSGPLWMADYYDRLIRSQKHFDWVLRYIENNPAALSPGSYRLGPH
ncbi:transposase [Haloferula sp.]|uniref:transposase n=1 Tax=Haloferula sp. TaxID=2497595 RepID=UPI003C784CD0